MMETLVSVRGELSRSEKSRESDVISKGEASWTRIIQGSPERRPSGVASFIHQAEGAQGIVAGRFSKSRTKCLASAGVELS